MVASRQIKLKYFLIGLLVGIAPDFHAPALAVTITFLLLGLWEKEWNMIGGIFLGLCFLDITHVIIHPHAFFEQFNYFHAWGHNISPIAGMLTEWKRWRSFFWEGTYHRNMFWLILIFGSITYPMTFISKILLCVLAGYAVSPSAKSTNYIVWFWPILLIWFFEVAYKRDKSIK